MHRFLAALCALVALPALAQETGWAPSKYGAADTIGAANNLSAEGAKRAAKLVKTGKVYQLGIVTGRATPAWPGRGYDVVVVGSPEPFGPHKGTSHDDVLMTYVGIGTQIDGFAHVGIDNRYYNGVHVRDIYRPDGVVKYGTETIPPAATRGVLLDMTKVFGRSPVAAGVPINRAQIEAAAKAAKITIGKGDVVLLHTGWMETAKTDPKGYIEKQPGLGVEGAEYLASLGVVMIGSDTAALEVIPAEDPERFGVVHQTLLAKHGVHLLEAVNTAELAADGATEFMFVLGVPRFQGTVQMVVNPVAIR